LAPALERGAQAARSTRAGPREAAQMLQHGGQQPPSAWQHGGQLPPEAGWQQQLHPVQGIEMQPPQQSLPPCSLTDGAVPELILRQQQSHRGSYQPILQVLELSVPSPPEQASPQALALSDGRFTATGVIGREQPAASLFFGQDAVQVHSFVQLITWDVQEKQGRRYIFIRDMRHVALHRGAIGSPTQFNDAVAPGQDQGFSSFLSSQEQAAAVAPPPQPQPQPQQQPWQQQQQQQQQQQPWQQQQGEPSPYANAQRQQVGPSPYAAAAPPPQQQGEPSPYANAQRQQAGPSPYAAAAPPQQQVGTSPYAMAQPPPQQQQAAGYAAGAAQQQPPSTRRGGVQEAGFTPIAQLSNYNNQWKIKARLISKHEIRRFRNARGDGQLMKVDLADASGEISGTFFGRAVDNFDSLLQQGEVYTFTKGRVQAANKKFDQGEYSIMFEESSIIERVGQDESIPRISYEFRKLCEVPAMEPNAITDFSAVVYAVAEPFTFTAKTSKREMTKRTVGLWDNSGPDGSTCVDLTLWGERAVSFNVAIGAVLFGKGAKVNEFNGSRSLASPASYEVEPQALPAPELRASFEDLRGGTRASLLKPLTSFQVARKTLEAVREEDLRLGPALQPGQPFDPSGPRSLHKHAIVATVTHIPEDKMPCYPACPEQVDAMPRFGQQAGQGPPEKRACQKKMSEEGPNCWRCGNGHEHAMPVYRYIARMKVTDYTESLEVNLFDEEAKVLFECEASAYAATWEENQDTGHAHPANRRALWRRISLEIKAQKEIWQDAERVKYSVAKASPVDLVKEGKMMLAEVRASLAASA